jgi:uncharacterized protein (TIRG00374 family)
MPTKNQNSTDSRRQQILNLLAWLLKFGVSTGLIWYLLEKISSSNVVKYVLELSIDVLLFSIFLIIVQGILAAIRWRLVITAIGHRLSLIKATIITFVGLFFNQFMPASIGGDAVRIWQSKKAGLPMPIAVTSVMLERFGSFLAVTVLSLSMLPILTIKEHNEFIYMISILAATAGIAALGLIMFLDRLPINLHHLKSVQGAGELARYTRMIFLNAKLTIYFFLTALGSQVLLSLAAFSLANGMGLDVDFIECLAIMPSVMILSSLPISVGGWGVREVAMVSAFGIFGVAPEAATALSVILALTASVASIPGGILFVILKFDNSTA